MTYATVDDLPPHLRAQARAQLGEPSPPIADVVSSMPTETQRRPMPAAIGDVDALANQAMNKTEAAYSAVLDARKARGEVAWWRFGALNLRIGEKCFYHTDFMVLLADGHIELHETKGFMRDDAQVKLRAIREMYPFFAVVVVKKGKGGTWEYDRR